MSKSVGSRWWKIDFHTHTPASKDDFGKGDRAQEKLSPEDWLHAAMQSELDAVVVSDHNTGEFVDKLKDALCRVKKQQPDWYRPLTIFPGVEISVGGNGARIHVLGVFDPSMDSSGLFGILGKCGICDHFGEAEACFTDKGIAEVVKIIHDQGGLAIPAHVDAEKGVLQNRDTLTPELKKWLPMCSALQVETCVKMKTKDDGLIVGKLAQVCGSDAHVSTDIGRRYSWIKMGQPTIDALRIALHDHVFCVKPDTVPCPNVEPPFFIKNIAISGLRCCGRGPAGPLTVEFSPHLTSLIGGRGTGKSTVLECLRYVFRQTPDQENSPQLCKRLEKFSRHMFVEGSSLSVEFSYHGSLYRISWSFSGDEDVLKEYSFQQGQWTSVAHGDVSVRFPVGIYSQKQLFELAAEPRGLLAIVDRSEMVNREEWDRRWERKKSEYLQLCVRARELRNRVKSVESLATRIADLDKKIAEYQGKGCGEILRRLAIFNRQDGALRVEDDVKAVAADIRGRVESLAVPDFPENHFPAGDEAYDTVRQIYAALSEKTSEAYKAISTAADGVVSAVADYRRSVAASIWAVRKSECDEAYSKMANELKAKGDSFDPDVYGRWVSERSQLVSEHARLAQVKQEQEQALRGIKGALGDLNALRQELCQRRSAFIQAVIGGNDYVRMTVQPFADMSTLERDLRSIFGIDGERYATSLYSSEEKTGLLADLINWQERGFTVRQLPDKLDEMKKIIWAGAHDKPTGFQKAFDTRLKSIYEENPTVFNEFSAYFPEDRLEVQYVSNGKPQLLDRGSAGQKSAAILAFLLSYGDEPLILDQPEDDLDNSLIMELVVRQLQANKQRRQLIVATHNPNIVVNGDSEQVCVMKFAGGLIGTLRQNSLDDSEVRQHVCDIMEGGAEAFRKRYDRMIGGADRV